MKPSVASPASNRGRASCVNRCSARWWLSSSPIIIFSAVTDSFLEPQNVSLILQQSVVVGILAVGQTLIILTSGIDLSIGAVAVFGTIVMAKSAGAGGASRGARARRCWCAWCSGRSTAGWSRCCDCRRSS